MNKSIVISERDNIAAVLENNRAVEFYIHKGDILLNDVYLAKVENILPSIDAAFVNVGSDKMGFLHASDVIGKGALQDKLKPGQKIIVQVVKEPTGHKGPRVTMSLSLPGRFLVLMPEEKSISISRKISSAKERARLKSIVSLIKPAGLGVIIRTEAENQTDAEIQEDLEILLEKWTTIVNSADTIEPPNLLYRDQDLLYRVIREACNENIEEIIFDTPFAMHRATQILQSWNMGKNIKLKTHKGADPLLVATGVDKEIKSALQTKVNLPSGGYLFIQTTEALSVVDVNSGKFTSSATQAETIKFTNLEAIEEIARQLRLRNIGGMIIIDFIDMESRIDKIAILEALELALEPDKAKPTVGQLSDLGLVELTRHRQGQSLAEIFTKKCPACGGTGHILTDLSFASSPQETEANMKNAKMNKMPQKNGNRFQQQNNNNQNNNNNNNNNNLRPERLKNQNQQQQPLQRAVQTTPSAVAEALNAEAKNTSSIDENFVLTMHDVEDFFTKNNYYINVAKKIKIAATPSSFIRKNLTGQYTKDVFTILEDLQKAAAQPVQQPVIQPAVEVAQAQQTQPSSVEENSTIQEQPAVNTETVEEKPKRPRKITRAPRKKKEESSSEPASSSEEGQTQTSPSAPPKRPRRPRTVKKAAPVEKEE